MEDAMDLSKRRLVERARLAFRDVVDTDPSGLADLLPVRGVTPASIQRGRELQKFYGNQASDALFSTKRRVEWTFEIASPATSGLQRQRDRLAQMPWNALGLRSVQAEPKQTIDVHFEAAMGRPFTSWRLRLGQFLGRTVVLPIFVFDRPEVKADVATTGRHTELFIALHSITRPEAIGAELIAHGRVREVMFRSVAQVATSAPESGDDGYALLETDQGICDFLLGVVGSISVEARRTIRHVYSHPIGLSVLLPELAELVHGASPPPLTLASMPSADRAIAELDAEVECEDSPNQITLAASVATALHASLHHLPMKARE